MLRTPWPQPVLLYPPYLHGHHVSHLTSCTIQSDAHPECLSKQKMTFFEGSRLHHSLPWSVTCTLYIFYGEDARDSHTVA